jgi:hypothetical protein
MDGATARSEFLAKVESAVCGARNESYDDAATNFARIATIANIVLGKKLSEPLDSVDVALFSLCIKMGRLAFDPRHWDSWLDTAGYSACGAGIIMQEIASLRELEPGEMP